MMFLGGIQMLNWGEMDYDVLIIIYFEALQIGKMGLDQKDPKFFLYIFFTRT